MVDPEHDSIDGFVGTAVDIETEYVVYPNDKIARAASGKYIDIDRIDEISVFEFKKRKGQIRICSCQGVHPISGCTVSMDAGEVAVRVNYIKLPSMFGKAKAQKMTIWKKNCFFRAVELSVQALGSEIKDEYHREFNNLQLTRKHTDPTEIRLNVPLAFKDNLLSTKPPNPKNVWNVYKKRWEKLDIENDFKEFLLKFNHLVKLYHWTEDPPIAWSQFLVEVMKNDDRIGRYYYDEYGATKDAE